MATQPSPNYFDIEDTKTGKIYRLEGTAPDTTYDEAVDYLSSLPENEWAQFEYTPPQQPSAAGAPTPQVQRPQVQQPQRPNYWQSEAATYSGQIRATRALEERADIAARAGEYARDPNLGHEEINRRLTEEFGSSIGQSFDITPEHLAQAREFDIRHQQNGEMLPPEKLWDPQIATGLVDEAAPETVGGTFVNAAQRSALNMANSTTALAGLAADLVGLEDLSDQMMEEYLQREVAIALDNPGSLQSEDVTDFGSGLRYAADIFGELAPQLLTMTSGGALAGKAARKIGDRAAKGLVEEAMAKGATREAAEAIAQKALMKQVAKARTMGAAGLSVAQETGITAGETYGNTGETGGLTSVVAGIASGSLDAILPTQILGKIGGAPLVAQFKREIMKDLALAPAKGFVLEGATEVMQEFINTLPTAVITGESPLTPEMYARMKEAFIRGGIGGAAIKTATGAYDAATTKIIRTDTGANVFVPVTDTAKVTETKTITRGKNKGKTKQVTTERVVGVKASDAARRVAEVTYGWTNAPDTIVVNNVDDLDPALGQEVTAANGETAFGFYTRDGQVVIMTDNIQDLNDIAPLMFHEALGHAGMNQEYGAALDGLLEDLYARNDTLQRDVDAWMAERPGETLAVAVEEVLAEFSEAGEIEQGTLSRIRAFVEGWGQKLGIRLEGRDRREVIDFLAKSHRRITEGKRVDVDTGGVRFIRTWHISPEDFDAFDDAYLLSGEGQMMFTSGHYSLEADPVRRQYIRQFMEAARKRAGVDAEDVSAYAYELELPDDHWMEYDATLANQEPLVRDALLELYEQALINQRKRPGTKEDLRQLELEMIQVKNDIDALELRLSETPETDTSTVQMLENDLDNLREIEKEVQQDLDSIVVESLESIANNLTGADVYRYISNNLFDGDQYKTSKALRERGVVGTQFLDHTSRAVDRTKLEEWRQARIKTETEWHEQIVSATSNALRALRNNRETAKSNGEDTAWYDEQIARYEERQNEADDNLHEALEEIRKESTLTYNYVTYDPNDIKIIKKHRIADGPLPPVDQHTYPDLEEKGGVRFMRDRKRKQKALENGAESRGFAGNVNLNRLETQRGEGVYDFIREAAAEAPEIDVQTDEELMARAKAMDLGFDEIKELNPGLDPAIAHSVGVALVARAEKLDRLADLIDTGEATDKQKADFAEAFLELGVIYEQYSQMANNAGRLLRSFRLAKAASMEAGIRFSRDADATMAGGVEAVAREIKNSKGKVGKAAKARMHTMSAVSNALNLPRTLMASMDLSAPLRQGIVLIGTKEYWKAFVHMFRLLGSEAAYEGMMDEIMTRKSYPAMKKAGLSLTSIDGHSFDAREEQFMSNWGEKIPVVGTLVRVSERAFVGFLNKLRADTFDSLMTSYEKAGMDLKADNGKLLYDTASFINAATGRGPLNLGFGSLDPSKKYDGGTATAMMETAAPLLNGLFFSPRLMASRLSLLNPVYYARLSPPARKFAIRSMASFGTAALTVMYLMSMAFGDDEDFDIEVDPRSSDFGKLRFGTKRYDILGGFGQYGVLAARIATRETKSTSGEIKNIEGGFGQDTALDVTERFFENKASPVASFFLDVLRGSDPVGGEVKMVPEELSTEELGKNPVLSRMVPLFLQDAYEMMKEDGFFAGALAAAPAFFGVGVQNFDRVPSKSPMLLANDPDNPYLLEIDRLREELNVRPIGPTQKSVDLGAGEEALSEEEYARYNELADIFMTEDLPDVMDSDEYGKASEREKLDMIREVTKNARKDARETLGAEIYGED